MPGLLQSDEFWLLESSSSSRDVPIDDMAADTTVSVGLRGSLPADTLLFIAVVVVDVARILVQVVDDIILFGSIGSIWNGTEEKRETRRDRRKWMAELSEIKSGETSRDINQRLVMAALRESQHFVHNSLPVPPAFFSVGSAGKTQWI